MRNKKMSNSTITALQSDWLVNQTIQIPYPKGTSIDDYAKTGHEVATTNGILFNSKEAVVGLNPSFINVKNESGRTIPKGVEIIVVLAERLLNDVLTAEEKALPKTVTGTYTSNGSAGLAVNLGGKPDFVVVKTNGQPAVFANRLNFFRRTDHFANNSSIAEEFGITITDTGFRLGNDNKVNQSTPSTYYYFAYFDNGSKSMLQGNWQGNETDGRLVDIFAQTPLQAAIIKRDNPRAPVYLLADEPFNYFFNDSTNAVSIGTTLSGDSGEITVGGGSEVNQWTGILGEGTNCFAFPKDSKACFAKKYNSNGSIRNIILPFEPDMIFLVPRSTTTAVTRMWLSSFPTNNTVSLSTGSVANDILTVNKNMVTLLAGTAMNTNGVEYALFAWRKCRDTALVPQDIFVTDRRKTLMINSGGYIDCGTDSSLLIDDGLTMEWYGAVTNIDTVQFAESATPDTDAGNQDKIIPLIFRSGGVDDANGNVSFGMAITAPPTSTDVWTKPVLMICTHDNWRMLKTNSGNLDQNPNNTGYIIEAGTLVHVVATHAGKGVWNVYVNAENVKERKRDLQASIGRPNVKGYAGHRTMILARQRDTIANTNGGAFKFAAIYKRALTPSEVRQNYLAIFGEAERVTSGLAEMWDAEKVTGNVLPASVNPANNGTIVSGFIEP
jgi:hypothetical protein